MGSATVKAGREVFTQEVYVPSCFAPEYPTPIPPSTSPPGVVVTPIPEVTSIPLMAALLGAAILKRIR
jgi:hypothetical protein